MRIQRVFLMLLLMFFCLSAFYQQPKFSVSYLRNQVNSSVQDSIGIPFEIVEEVPIFPGCEDATNKRACFKKQINLHVRNNFRYPEEAFRKGIKGKVNVQITFDEYGNISDTKYRSPHKILQKSTERIINLLPKMIPGKQNGKAVKVTYMYSVNYVISRSRY